MCNVSGVHMLTSAESENDQMRCRDHKKRWFEES